MLAEVLPDLPGLDVLLQVDDGTGHALLPGALDYEEALAAARPTGPTVDWSPDDLYILYTGGTTGMPKGVLWRQADIFVAGHGRPDVRPRPSECESLDDDRRGRRRAGGARLLVAPPFMHGAGHWAAFHAFTGGNTVVLQPRPAAARPGRRVATVEREQVAIAR